MVRGRARREKTGSREEKPRQRLLHDILRSSAFYQREGLYGGLSVRDDNFERVASRELATQLSIDPQGAKKVLKLVGILHIEDACRVLKENSRLGVFADYHFTKGYTSISNSGGSICIEFLEAFINGEDCSYHETMLQKRSLRRKLDALSLSFMKNARDLCVTMFLKAVAVVATLCSFMPPGETCTRVVVLDIIQRYLSAGWKCDSRQRLYHRDVNLVHFVDGWHLVGEVFKVSVQELLFWKDREFCKEEDTDSDVPNKSHVTEEDVQRNAHRLCRNVVSEFFAWCYQILAQDESVNSFLDYFFDVINFVNEQLCRDMGFTKIEPIQKQSIEALLQLIYDDGPTMADVKYDAASMRPSKRETRLNRKKRKTLWRPSEVLMRCRWEGSTVQKHYVSFLNRAEAEEVQAHQEIPVTEVQYQPNPPDETIVPETPPMTPVQSVTPVVGKRYHTGILVSNQSSLQGFQAARSKLLKIAVERNVRRLRQGIQPPQIEKDLDSIVNFVNDGDISDDEGLVRCRDIVPPNFAGEVSNGNPSGWISRETQACGTRHAEETNISIKLFYEAVLDWPIMPIRDSTKFNLIAPQSKQDEAAVSDLLSGDIRWANLYTRSQGHSILRNVTAASNTERYREHWTHFLLVEVRGALSEEISTLLPSAKEDPDKDWIADIAKERFISAKVDEVAPCKGIFNIVCRSTNAEPNQRSAKDLQGGTICVGYIEHTKQRSTSPLILILCRRVDWKDEDVVPQGASATIDEIKVHMVISRDRVRYSGGIWKGEDVLHFFHLCHFAPYLRMFKSVHEIFLLPQKVARIFCGPRNLIDFPEPVMDSLPRRGIDVGCENYIKAVKETNGLLDYSQLRAIRSVLKNIGACHKGSSSVTLIQGPPGTGKTTLINMLTGVLFAHSKAGHIGREQVNALKKDLPLDDILRCSTNELGLKILICCPSNQAVDNILRRMHDEGIPDARGGRFRPEAVRLAKAGYNYGDLQAYSINSKALPFDLFKHHINEKDRENASSKARKSFSKECLVVFCTLCTSGGSRLKDLKMSFDVIIVDEAGQSLEPECLIPVTTVMNSNAFGRCHLVLVGDPQQLPAVVKGSQLVVKSEMRRHIRYEEQMKSLLERLMRNERAAYTMLKVQYRMHFCISELHSSIFYNGTVKSVLPVAMFEAPYNRGWDPKTGCFAPVTLIDTSYIRDRFEIKNGNGSVVNLTEVNIIDEILHDLKTLSRDQFHALRNQICVIVPYRSQVSHARKVLERFGKYKDGESVSRQGFQIKVDTVDSMQGTQRDVIIFGATRSNMDQIVGFVWCANRLNVAMSRARKLLVVIADMSTLGNTKEFERIREYCITGRNGAAMLTRKWKENERCGTRLSELVFDSNYGNNSG